MTDEEQEVDIEVDIDQDGKTDFTIKLKGKAKFIGVCIACYFTGWLNAYGYINWIM